MSRNHFWVIEWKGLRGWEPICGKWYYGKEDAMWIMRRIKSFDSPGQKYRVAKYVRVEKKGGE